MTRGTWKGSGTFQTSGPDFTGLIEIGALLGAGVAVAMFVLEFIWYIVAFAAALVAGLVIAIVVMRRRMDARAAALEATRPARHAAILATDRPQSALRPHPQTVVHGNQTIVHGGNHYYLSTPEAVEALACAARGELPATQARPIPGPAGDAITERNLP
jgi:hypothetical protein